MPVVWFTRKQGGVSLSTMGKQISLRHCLWLHEMISIKELLGEMGIHCVIPMRLKVDNQAALSSLAENLRRRRNTLMWESSLRTCMPNVEFWRPNTEKILACQLTWWQKRFMHRGWRIWKTSSVYIGTRKTCEGARCTWRQLERKLARWRSAANRLKLKFYARKHWRRFHWLGWCVPLFHHP